MDKERRVGMKSLEVILGRYDDPENQIQDHYRIDLYSSNVAIFGVAMSGKTTFLKTLLIRIHQMIEQQDREEIYILDFNNGLQLYEKLPYVKACFDGTNDENVRRIFRLIEKKFSEYSQELSGKVYSQCSVEERPPHITFILDGLNSFFADGKYETYKEILVKLSRDGLAKGITIVFAANELAGGIGKMMGSFNRVIAFDLPKDKYSELFSTKVEKPMLMKGRGVVNIDSDTFEFQAYYPYNFEIFFGEDGEKMFLEDFVEKMKNYYKINLEKAVAEQLKTFTTDLDAEKWGNYVRNEKQVPAYQQGYLTVGLDYFNFLPISIFLKEANVIAIYGKKRSGKSNLLRLLLYGALGIRGVRFVFWEDKRNGLRDVWDIVEQNIIESFPEIGSPEESRDYPSWTQIKKKEDFFEFIETQGYYDVPDDIYGKQEKGEFVKKQKLPFTVFVIQSKQFYLPIQGKIGTQTISRLASFMASAADENVLFVFSDVQNITESEARNYFNNSVKYAFLFDDIVRFVRDTKGQQSVFGIQDPVELKEMFGKCEPGDGYLFDVEQSDEVMKFKMLNVSFEKMLQDQKIEKVQLWQKYQILERIHEKNYEEFVDKSTQNTQSSGLSWKKSKKFEQQENFETPLEEFSEQEDIKVVEEDRMEDSQTSFSTEVEFESDMEDEEDDTPIFIPLYRR